MGKAQREEKGGEGKPGAQRAREPEEGGRGMSDTVRDWNTDGDGDKQSERRKTDTREKKREQEVEIVGRYQSRAGPSRSGLSLAVRDTARRGARGRARRWGVYGKWEVGNEVGCMKGKDREKSRAKSTRGCIDRSAGGKTSRKEQKGKKEEMRREEKEKQKRGYGE